MQYLSKNSDDRLTLPAIELARAMSPCLLTICRSVWTLPAEDGELFDQGVDHPGVRGIVFVEPAEGDAPVVCWRL